MRCSAALSTDADSVRAIEEVVRHSRDKLGATPDLAVLFYSPDRHSEFEQMITTARRLLGNALLVGCSGESIVGVGSEVEQSSATSLWLANLPGVRMLPMHLQFDASPEGGSFSGWHSALDDAWPERASMLMLADPFTFPADVLLARLNEDRPGMPVFGGMSSGGWEQRQNRLVLDDQIVDAGAVVVMLDGALRVRTVVSQGCRPIGQPMVITKCERNIIFELGGKPAMSQLRELWPSLSADEQRSFQQGLHIGRVVNEYQDRFGRGDFLVRNVVGADPDLGALAVGDYLRVGQTVQLHIRDAQSADEDLQTLLAESRAAGANPAGGLLFTCNGRGTRLFDAPNHDAAAVDAAFSGLPLAGFFAQGEIGPIGGANFVHGFTASLALVEPE